MRLPCLLMIAIAFLSGCKESKIKGIAKELNKTNIQKVSNAFSLYSSMNNYQSPKTKEELIDYIKNSKHIDYNLDLMGIDRDSFEDMFVSSIDGEEFTIRFKSRVSAMGAAAPIAFEQKGIDGIRRVGLSNGKVIEADDEAYERLLKGKLTKEEKGRTAAEDAEAFDQEFDAAE